MGMSRECNRTVRDPAVGHPFLRLTACLYGLPFLGRPDNILLTREGHWKLGGFDFAMHTRYAVHDADAVVDQGEPPTTHVNQFLSPPRLNMQLQGAGQGVGLSRVLLRRHQARRHASCQARPQLLGARYWDKGVLGVAAALLR
jgi:hypothetical protein